MFIKKFWDWRDGSAGKITHVAHTKDLSLVPSTNVALTPDLGDPTPCVATSTYLPSPHIDLENKYFKNIF